LAESEMASGEEENGEEKMFHGVCLVAVTASSGQRLRPASAIPTPR
jgi:hypothetical protein